MKEVFEVVVGISTIISCITSIISLFLLSKILLIVVQKNEVNGMRNKNQQANVGKDNNSGIIQVMESKIEKNN